MALLSIVTPTFNAARFLPAAFESVSALPIPHEHLVVDGGSADATVELLAARDDPSLNWLSEPDRGQTHAVNKGLARASGEFIIWVNGDDEIVPVGVERAVEALRRDRNLTAAYGGLDFIDETGALRRRYRPAAWSFRRYLFAGDYVPTPTIVFRRDRIAEVGTLDERWVDAADYDFYLRVLHGARVAMMPDPHVRFRFHAASKTAKDVWRQQDEALAIRLRWARNARDRRAMITLDRLKRAAVPLLTRGRWPEPF